jgi:hypothetical protein
MDATPTIGPSVNPDPITVPNTAARGPRVYAASSIGWSDNNPATRNISRDYLRDPASWVRRVFGQSQKLAFDGGWMHNPDGCRNDPATTERNMRLDARLLAMAQGLTALEDPSLAEALREMNAQGFPIALYYGNPAKEVGSVWKLIEDVFTDPGQRTMIQTRFALYFVDLAIRTGCAVGLDASCGVRPKDPTDGGFYEIFMAIKSKAASVIIEPPANLGIRHLYDERSVIATDWLQKIEANPGWCTWQAPWNQISGEVIVLSNGYYRNAKFGSVPDAEFEGPKNKYTDWGQAHEGECFVTKYAVDQINKGRSVALGPWWFIEKGIPVKDHLREHGARI